MVKLLQQTQKELEQHAAKSKNCGQCAQACPTNFVGLFNPLSILRALQMGKIEDAIKKSKIYNCICCNKCMIECPSTTSPNFSNEKGMNIANLVRELRAYGIRNNLIDLNSLPKADNFQNVHLNSGNLKDFPLIERIKKDKRLKIAEKGEITFFSGDIEGPNNRLYFDMVESVIKILNRVKIEPVIIENPGSGHDDYWAGNYDIFQSIVQDNVGKFIKKGIKTIIVEDSETYHTLKYVYPKAMKDFSKLFNVIHLSQFLMENNRWKKLHFKPNFNISAMYQDNSRMGRMGDHIYSAPRKLLEKIGGIEIKELDFTKEIAFDIGTGIFIEPGEKLDKLNKLRVNEIEEGGADYLLTSSLKALYILEKQNIKTNIKEWAVFISRCIV